MTKEEYQFHIGPGQHFKCKTSFLERKTERIVRRTSRNIDARLNISESLQERRWTYRADPRGSSMSR